MNLKCFRNKLDISQFLFKKAKYQYDNGIIDKDVYEDTLKLIMEKINIRELDFNKVDYILEELKKEIFLVDIKETINVAFALN